MIKKADEMAFWANVTLAYLRKHSPFAATFLQNV